MDEARARRELAASMRDAPDTATRVLILNYARQVSPALGTFLAARIIVECPLGEVVWLPLDLH